MTFEEKERSRDVKRDKEFAKNAVMSMFSTNKPKVELGVYSVVIEVTDACNMECAHCLRGPSENAGPAEFETIKKTLDMFEWIDTICITGGEPTLAVDNIRKIYEYIIRRDWKGNLPGFYVAINGLIYSPELLNVLDMWTVAWLARSCGRTGSPFASGDKLASYINEVTRLGEAPLGLTISADIYHEAIPVNNVFLYGSRAYFRADKCNGDFRGGQGLINAGNAYLNGIGTNTPRSSEIVVGMSDTSEGFQLLVDSLYMSRDGYITGNCDMSNEDAKVDNLCNIHDVNKDEFVQMIHDIYNKETECE